MARIKLYIHSSICFGFSIINQYTVIKQQNSKLNDVIIFQETNEITVERQFQLPLPVNKISTLDLNFQVTIIIILHVHTYIYIISILSLSSYVY